MHLQLGDEIDVLEAQCSEIRKQNVAIKSELSKLRAENDELRQSSSALSSKARGRRFLPHCFVWAHSPLSDWTWNTHHLAMHVRG